MYAPGGVLEVVLEVANSMKNAVVPGARTRIQMVSVPVFPLAPLMTPSNVLGEGLRRGKRATGTGGAALESVAGGDDRALAVLDLGDQVLAGEGAAEDSDAPVGSDDLVAVLGAAATANEVPRPAEPDAPPHMRCD